MFLRKSQFHGLKFRRQYGIHGYIIDFYCPSIRLGIEVDGAQHYDQKKVIRDEIRTNELSLTGIRIVRFSNSDVLSNIDGVFAVLEQEVLHPKTPPQA